MIRIISDSHCHILNFPLGELVRTQEKFGAMARFAEDIGNTVGLYDFSMIIGIMVIVAFRMYCRERRKHHERISHRRALFQVIAGIVPTARNRILQMARTVEPGLGIATALRTEELEVCIAHHGIDLVAHDECRRKLFTHLDAKALVCRERSHFGKFARTYSLVQAPRKFY